MNRYFLILLFLLCQINIRAQFNLVPNGDFELMDSPCNVGGIYSAPPWIMPTAGSSDYFNSCATNEPKRCVPQNLFGYQYAHSGNGYAGFAITGIPYIQNYREYIQVKLSDTLKFNKKYFASFYVSLSDSCHYASNKIGLFFSNNAISKTGYDYSPFSNYMPQIENPNNNIITNDTGWTIISGIFTANGGEQYITIGNFYDEANTITLFVGGSLNNAFCGSYYYIDDVSVVQMPEINAGISDTICKGEAAILQGTLNDKWQGMSAYWLPQAGLAAPDSLQTMAAPAVTTTYYLHVKCDSCAEPYDSIAATLADSVTIFVEGCEDTSENYISLPNAFTPNGDGVNDVFTVKGKNIKTLQGTIINRWGQELFKWSDINGGWDGRFKGQDVSEGAYFYVIDVTFMDGEFRRKTGSLELIR